MSPGAILNYPIFGIQRTQLRCHQALATQQPARLHPGVSHICYTIRARSFQIFHTYRKSVADITFHSAVYFCYFDISQTWKLLFGKVLPSWSQVLTVTTPRNKRERFVSQMHLPVYLYCPAAIARSLTSCLSYPLMIWPSNSLALLCQ